MVEIVGRARARIVSRPFHPAEGRQDVSKSQTPTYRNIETFPQHVGVNLFVIHPTVFGCEVFRRALRGAATADAVENISVHRP